MNIDIDQIQTKSIEFTYELMNAFYKYSIIGGDLLDPLTTERFLHIQDVIYTFLQVDNAMTFQHKTMVMQHVINNIESLSSKTADAQLRDQDIDDALAQSKTYATVQGFSELLHQHEEFFKRQMEHMTATNLSDTPTKIKSHF